MGPVKELHDRIKKEMLAEKKEARAIHDELERIRKMASAGEDVVEMIAKLKARVLADEVRVVKLEEAERTLQAATDMIGYALTFSSYPLFYRAMIMDDKTPEEKMLAEELFLC